MADFIAELAPLLSPGGDDLSRRVLQVDGSSNEKGSGTGVLLQAPSGDRFEYAVIAGLSMTEAMKATRLDI